MARTNTLKTFLLISICFVLCWSCSQFNYLLYNIGYPVDFNGMFDKISLLVAFCNCTINPFVYLFKYRDYQAALKELFSCGSKETKTTNSISTMLPSGSRDNKSISNQIS